MNIIKSFIESLDFTRGKYINQDIFRDVISLTVYIIQVFLIGNKNYIEDLDTVLKKYNESEKVMLQNLAYKLINIYKNQKEPVDILGEVFNQLNMSNVKTGQFFTPTHISKAIAKITGIDEDAIKKNGYTRIHEPSCGAGGIILAYAKEIQAIGYDTYRNMLVQCWDIDRNCALMTYIQLSMYDIPAEVICGDILAYKSSEILYTPAYYLFQQLKKENKLKVPLCDLCSKEITGKIKYSQFKPNLKLCEQCYRTEQRVILVENIVNVNFKRVVNE